MKKPHSLSSVIQLTSILTLSITLSACGKGGWWSEDEAKSLNQEQIKKLIPARVNDRASWAEDIASITETLKIPNICLGFLKVRTFFIF